MTSAGSHRQPGRAQGTPLRCRCQSGRARGAPHSSDVGARLVRARDRGSALLGSAPLNAPPSGHKKAPAKIRRGKKKRDLSVAVDYGLLGLTTVISIELLAVSAVNTELNPCWVFALLSEVVVTPSAPFFPAAISA